MEVFLKTCDQKINQRHMNDKHRVKDPVCCAFQFCYICALRILFDNCTIRLKKIEESKFENLFLKCGLFFYIYFSISNEAFKGLDDDSSDGIKVINNFNIKLLEKSDDKR
jgi:hypothetical protein